MRDAAVDDEQWARLVEDHLRRVTPTLVPGAGRIEHVAVLAPDVWLLHLAGGGRVVAKHQFYGLLTRDEPYDLLQVELDVLRALRRSGHSVPVPFGIDPQGQFIFLEYVGSRTLEDVLCAGEAGWICRIVPALLNIEQTLAADEQWSARVIRGAEKIDLLRAWSGVETVALQGLTRWAAWANRPCLIDDLTPVVRSLHRELATHEPTLGATDYQPRNIVCGSGGHRLAFLELGKLGWDWTTRRALQYTTPLREMADSAEMESACLRELSASMPSDSARRSLDAHHLFFRLLLAARDPASAGLALLSESLSDEPSMQTLRRHLSALPRETRP